MPTLAPPAPPARFAPPAPATSPPRPLPVLLPSSQTGAPTGSLAAYTSAFALDIAALRGRDVLDVGAGRSSFTAEACARRVDAVAVDPIYGRSPELAIAPSHAETAAIPGGWPLGSRRAGNRTTPGTHPGRGLFALGPTGRSAVAEPDRRTPEERFLDDYQAHYPHGRYVTGALPRLPFFDATFDLVLCDRLLFVEAYPFDFDGHVAACREMARVAAGEVRIHPLGAAGRRFAGLPRLRRELKEFGIDSEIHTVPPDLARSGGSMLVLQRASP